MCRTLRPVRVLGADGCPGGWAVAEVETVPRPRLVRLHRLPTAAAVMALADAVGAVAVGVDMPIGLAEDGPRAVDAEVRRRLSPYAARVFPAPVRAVLDAGDYPQACALSRAARPDGRALPLQTWHLLPRIREWDALVTPALRDRVAEVHPELSFAVLTGAPLTAKATPAGRAARTAALDGWCAGLPEAMRARPAPVEDCLDAVACAWSAARWAAGTAETVPADPPLDADGRPMRVVV